MKIRPTINRTSLDANLRLRRESINHEAKQIYLDFSKLRNLSEEIKIRTMHVPAGFSVNSEGGLVGNKFFSVDVLIHQGYLVARNSAFNYMENGIWKTKPVNDELYEIIVPAKPKYQFAKEGLRKKVIEAIIKAVEVSTTPAPVGRVREVKDIVIPLLQEREVDIVAKLEKVPASSIYEGSYPVSDIVDAWNAGNNLPLDFDCRLNQDHLALVGLQRVKIFKRVVA